MDISVTFFIDVGCDYKQVQEFSLIVTADMWRPSSKGADRTRKWFVVQCDMFKGIRKK